MSLRSVAIIATVMFRNNGPVIGCSPEENRSTALLRFCQSPIFVHMRVRRKFKGLNVGHQVLYLVVAESLRSENIHGGTRPVLGGKIRIQAIPLKRRGFRNVQ